MDIPLAGGTAELLVPAETVHAHRVSPSLLTLDDAGNVGLKIINDEGQVEFVVADIAMSSSNGVWLAGLPDTATIITVGQGFVVPGTMVDAVPESDIETAVEAYIQGLRSQGKLAPDERTGWSVYDFTTGRKLVTINEEVQFQAASLIKPFIAAAFFHRVDQGDLIYGPKSRRQMERMIQNSNNQATNWVMRQVGGPQRVQRILQENYPGIFRDTRILEYIPPGGRTYRNKASARDYSRFLYAIWNDEISGAREIKRLMALPGPDRILTGAEEIPNGTRVFNKTGSTSRLCADMGILSVEGPDGKRYAYTLIGIIEKQNKARNFTAWIHSRGDVIRDVSDIVYRGIARRHDFGDLL